MFDKLEELLRREAQRFICRKGWPQPCPPEHRVAIGHEVGRPLNAGELRALEHKVGNLPELLAFYSTYSYLCLYRQLDADEAAYYIAPPGEWEDLEDSFNDWIDQLDADERNEILPNWIESFVVVGRVPKSATYFLVPLAGEEAGAVYEFEHDGYEFIQRGTSIGDFVNKLSTVDAQLLDDIASNTRYRDGRPESQWIVEGYEYGT